MQGNDCCQEEMGVLDGRARKGSKNGDLGGHWSVGPSAKDKRHVAFHGTCLANVGKGRSQPVEGYDRLQGHHKHWSLDASISHNPARAHHSQMGWWEE